MTGWIEIPNWDEFQHYKDRDPLWIKSYTRLLSDPAYLGLTAQQRSTLHGLWLMYAKSHRNIPENTSYVSRQLAQRVTKRTLEALNHAGFITIVASRPLAPRYQDASPEKELREEKDLFNKTPRSKTAKPKRGTPDAEAFLIRTMIANGAIPDLEYLETELASRGLNGDHADQLRALLTTPPDTQDPHTALFTPTTPDDNIPF